MKNMGTASTASESENFSLQKQVKLMKVFMMLILVLFAMTVMMGVVMRMLVSAKSRVGIK